MSSEEGGHGVEDAPSVAESVVWVTPAQRDMARLDLDLAAQLGETPDPSVVRIAQAEATRPAGPRNPRGGAQPGREPGRRS